MKASYLKYLKPIQTRRDYKRALAVIEKYFDAKPNTAEGNLVEILAVLIEKYEDQKFPIEVPDPVEAIKFRMEQLGLTTRDLALIIGGRNRVSEIFNKRRQLSIQMIRNIHKKMGIPAESLIGAYSV
ncbi:MAG: helix-turn-helix domain-containing protein [Bacteroidota bacterium]